MLAAHEFTAGRLADARPLSLLLALSDNDSTFLVGGTLEAPVAIFCGHEVHVFQCFDAREGTNWRGLIVPDIRIEIDETSVFDAGYVATRLGTLLRTGPQLQLCAKADQSFSRQAKVTLQTGLPPTHDVVAAFSRWRIVVGEGLDRRVLREIDVSARTSEHHA